MTTKHLLTAGLLLLLAGPAFATQEAPPAPSVASQTATTATAQSDQARPQAQAPAPVQLAWQRVGSPLSLEG